MPPKLCGKPWVCLVTSKAKWASHGLMFKLEEQSCSALDTYSPRLVYSSLLSQSKTLLQVISSQGSYFKPRFHEPCRILNPKLRRI
ncbi:hypothetical protein RJ641_016043 [Dillenia turbinata]|uniref:Uncharacterized protein n=1 Tax=Dillenia turbinata TaxID=194707 RepID=A0AAN8UT41_9MAGN